MSVIEVYIDLGELAYLSTNDVAYVRLFSVPSKASIKTMIQFAPIPVLGLKVIMGVCEVVQID
jgi:hypothetical protein